MNKSLEDYSIGFAVFKDNLRAYVSVVLFVIVSAFGILLVGKQSGVARRNDG